MINRFIVMAVALFSSASVWSSKDSPDYFSLRSDLEESYKIKDVKVEGDYANYVSIRDNAEEVRERITVFYLELERYLKDIGLIKDVEDVAGIRAIVNAKPNDAISLKKPIIFKVSIEKKCEDGSLLNIIMKLNYVSFFDGHLILCKEDGWKFYTLAEEGGKEEIYEGLIIERDQFLGRYQIIPNEELTQTISRANRK